MTNREAIKLLKTILRTVCLGNQKFIDAVKKAISALEKDKWIPVSERLPEEYGEYRITWKTSSDPDKRLIGDAEYEPGYEWDDDHDRFKGEWLLEDYIKAYPGVEVIAWKPIGEPYTEEES